MAIEKNTERFQEIVKELKLNNKQIAELLGIHERTFYRWFFGDTRVPISAIKLLELQKPAE